MSGSYSSAATIEEINALIEKAVDRLLGPKKRFFLFRQACRAESEALTPFLAEMLTQYFSLRSEELDNSIMTFYHRYEAFLSEFRILVGRFSYTNQEAYAIISIVWMEVLRKLEQKQRRNGDALAASIFMQLHSDIILHIEHNFGEEPRYNPK